tara:strand:+ start:4129 stop:6501 length:2373 start_codon:yes stop_codon:yes gene_type:complete
MSDNNEEDTEISVMTQENIDNRRIILGDVADNINANEDALDPYITSNERANDLREQNDVHANLINTIEQEDQANSKKINNQPVKLGEYNKQLDSINKALDSNNFEIPNVKISKITGYVNEYKVIGIQFESSNGNREDHGILRTNLGTQGIIVINLQPTEFLMKIDKIDTGDGSAGTMGNGLIFYTSYGNKHIVKGKNVNLDNAQEGFENLIEGMGNSTQKIFTVNMQIASWEEHKDIAKQQGKTLACIANSGENDAAYNAMLDALGEEVSAWMGGIRIRPGRGSGKSSWKWIDETPWNYTNWGGGEPNDCCRGEPYLMMRGDGRWNDLFAHRLPAIYQSEQPLVTTSTVSAGTGNRSITGVSSFSGFTNLFEIEGYKNLKEGMQVVTSEKYQIDTNARDNLISMKQGVHNNIAELNNASLDAQVNINSNKIKKTQLEEEIALNKKEITTINNLNNKGQAGLASINEGFTNKKDNENNIVEKFTSFVKNIFTDNKNMKEGFNSPFYDYMLRTFRDTRQSVNDELAVTDNLEYEENRNYMLELLAQKDQVLSNVMMDYMINDTEGSNAEQLYEIMNQENQDKLRKIKINDYYSKTYIEYSHILKIIIVLVLIMVPILLLAKYEKIPKNISLIIIVVIIFLGFLYVLYRLYLLYMKDNKDYDKDRIPYDRYAEELKKEGKLKQKKGVGGLGITCIGEECCSDDMIYDHTKHKCFPINQNESASESFTNFFEGMNNLRKKEKSIVSENNLHQDVEQYTPVNEPFVTSMTDVRNLKTKSLIESLNRSTENNMFFN